MELLQVLEMLLGILGGAAAVLAHAELGASLHVAEGQLDLVHFVEVRLEAAALRELAVALGAVEGSDAFLNRNKVAI